MPMDYASNGLGAGKIAAIVILVLLAACLGAGATYYLAPQHSDAVVNKTRTTTDTSTMSVGADSMPTTNAPQASSINSVSIYDDSNESVVTIEGYKTSSLNVIFGFGVQSVTEEVLGSGFAMKYANANYIVTNFHVVDGASNLTVTFWNGDAYPATVVGTDPYSDLAVVKASAAPASEFHPLTLSPSSSVRVGDSVAAIGNPYGLAGSMTVGVVSQLGRTITESTAGKYSIADVIQFSAPINPGNSGGPLFNVDGRVIGLTTATVSGSEGVGFAIPSDTVSREIGSLIANGTYTGHPYLGIGTVEMSYQLAKANGNNVTYGVLVENVVPGGPAAASGIHAGTKQATVEGQTYLLGGDVIVSLNGTRIVDLDALASYLEENVHMGHTLVVGVMRGTSYMTFDVKVAARPPPSTPAGAA